MSADGGHFEPRSGSLNTILEVNLLRTIDDSIQHADILKRTYLCQVSDTGSPEPLVTFHDLACSTFKMAINIED
jgi:hypothetical protein